MRKSWFPGSDLPILPTKPFPNVVPCLEEAESIRSLGYSMSLTVFVRLLIPLFISSDLISASSNIKICFLSGPFTPAPYSPMPYPSTRALASISYFTFCALLASKLHSLIKMGTLPSLTISPVRITTPFYMILFYLADFCDISCLFLVLFC